MKNDLSYLSPEGFTVFTSQFHKNRGTCCKSACLHCPFGYTIKKLGIQFQDVSPSDEEMVNEILNENQEQSLDWKSFLPENIKFVKVKGMTCGLLFKNHIVIKKLLLKPQFKDQDISKELVESYLFI